MQVTRIFKLKWIGVVLLGLIFGGNTAEGQSEIGNISELDIMSEAPNLKVSKWVKGNEVRKLKKGNIYVIEFFSTWCVPCKASMPRLSTLVNAYKGKVTFMAIDIMEGQNLSIENVQRLIDGYGTRINYPVAIDSSEFMETNWFKPLQYENGIPITVIVNRDLRIAWYGHPMYLDGILARVVSSNWDLQRERNNKLTERYLDSLDEEASYELAIFRAEWRSDSTNKPLEALEKIDEILRREPRLRSYYHIKYEIFASLLQTDPEESLKYGRTLLLENDPLNDQSEIIFDNIKRLESQLTLAKSIYKLGADAYRVHINSFVYPEIITKHRFYYWMAIWYAKADEIEKAVESIEIAIKLGRNVEGASNEYLSEMESFLENLKFMYQPISCGKRSFVAQ